MTKADTIHDELAMVEWRNNHREIVDTAVEFYRRISPWPWCVTRACVNVYEWTLHLRRWSGGEEEVCITHRYQSSRNTWLIQHHICSDASVAEYLGVSVGYLGGLSDAMQVQGDILKAVERDRISVVAAKRRVKGREKTLANTKARLKKEEATLTERAVRGREISKIKHANGVRTAQLMAKAAQQERISLQNGMYPKVPAVAIKAARFKDSGLPGEAGIYFVWRNGCVVYVGQSISLRERATTLHENIEEGDSLSWVTIDPRTLDFAECYYIGILQPQNNFGTRARHRRGGDDRGCGEVVGPRGHTDRDKPRVCRADPKSPPEGVYPL